MTSSNDEGAFYGRIAELDFYKIRDEINAELGRKPDPRFAEFLKGLRWFLDTRAIPSNFESWQIDRLKMFASDLVERGFLKSTVLEQFSN